MGIAAMLAVAVPGLGDSPALAVVLAVAVTMGLAGLWRNAVPITGGIFLAGSVRGSAAVALGFWAVVSVSDGAASREAWLAVAASMAVATWVGVAWILASRRAADPHARTLAAAMAVAALVAWVAAEGLATLVSCGVIYALVALAFGPRKEQLDDPSGRWWAAVLEHPERLLVISFATLAALGGLLLAMPQSSIQDGGIPGLDAAFTAVSGVCVTGLIVRDTPVEFTTFGLVVILALIQLGGLGIMTFSTAALRVVGGRMGIRQESAVARVIGVRDRSRVISSAQDVLRVTFVVEAIGVVVLTALFAHGGEPIGDAAWRACFTSVSAYCNAGFALQSDSLLAYQGTPMVLQVVAALIVLGGLSPAIILGLATRRSSGGPAPVQHRMCLYAAGILLLLGFVLFLAWEWNGVLAGMPLGDKLHNAWFQSATLRTAGFNSVDVAAIGPATYVLMLCWMFVGASPGGTAGGVKTTTVAILLLSVVDTMRGRSRISAFGRRIPAGTMRRAAAIVTVSAGFAVCAILALALTQRIPLPSLTFEVISALGTVGLSQGATGMLDSVGKVIIIICMFVGRIGGLTLIMVMSQGPSDERITLPSEDVDVG